MDFSNLYETSKPIVVAMGLKIAGAIVIYIVGRMLIGLVGTIITKAMERQKIEPTVIRYFANAIAVALNVMLVVGILGYFGVETTSFAALIAALGIAIGAAWGGLLSNFAAGASALTVATVMPLLLVSRQHRTRRRRSVKSLRAATWPRIRAVGRTDLRLRYARRSRAASDRSPWRSRPDRRSNGRHRG